MPYLYKPHHVYYKVDGERRIETRRDIWGRWSAKNEAMPGVNVGHVSITTSEAHISLWPGSHREEREDSADRSNPSFFGRIKATYDAVASLYKARDAKYRLGYELDCAMEGYHEEDEHKCIGGIDELGEGEEAYRLDTLTDDLERVTEIPPFCPDNHVYLAIKPKPANIRIVLYSLDEDEVNNAFDRLKRSTTGWTLAGSSFLTRNFQQETNENCSSIAYRCLVAGGLYKGLKVTLSSETSSVVSPEDLLRHVVAAKELELKDHPETADWQIEGVEETPLEVIKEAYQQVGQEVNASKQALPKFKPTVPINICSLF